MKNIYDVMRQKETEIQQLQKDIEALRVAARILADETEATADAYGTRTGTSATTSAANAPGLRPTPPSTPVQVNKTAEVTYSAVRENSLRQFP